MGVRKECNETIVLSISFVEVVTVYLTLRNVW